MLVLGQVGDTVEPFKWRFFYLQAFVSVVVVGVSARVLSISTIALIQLERQFTENRSFIIPMFQRLYDQDRMGGHCLNLPCRTPAATATKTIYRYTPVVQGLFSLEYGRKSRVALVAQNGREGKTAITRTLRRTGGLCQTARISGPRSRLLAAPSSFPLWLVLHG